MGETLLAAAEVGEVAAEHGERSDLCLACADVSRERERLLADRQRLRMAPGHHQPSRERSQRIRALRRRRLRRHELDRALERGEESVGTAGRVEVFTEAHMEERRTVRVFGADELDRSPPELNRTGGSADFAGELGRPGAELGEIEPGELGRVRDRGPERERPLEVRLGLGEAEDGLGLARRFDRRGERLRAAARRLPVRRELRRRCSSAARELLGEARVQFLPLARQDRRVDRFGEQGVAEAEAARRLLGDEDAVVDRPAQRLAHVGLRERRCGAEQRVAHVASGGRGQAQEALRRGVELRDALQQQVAQATRELAALARPRRRGAPRRRRDCPLSGRRSRSSALPAAGRRRES